MVHLPRKSQHLGGGGRRISLRCISQSQANLGYSSGARRSQKSKQMKECWFVKQMAGERGDWLSTPVSPFRAPSKKTLQSEAVYPLGKPIREGFWEEG